MGIGTFPSCRMLRSRVAVAIDPPWSGMVRALIAVLVKSSTSLTEWEETRSYYLKFSSGRDMLRRGGGRSLIELGSSTPSSQLLRRTHVPEFAFSS